MIRWCAIGDSFTYLNDHPDETNHYVTKGYLSRTLDSLRAHGLDAELINIGINGSTTRDWLTAPLVPADFYTILLGTNDWHSGIPLGTEEDFSAARPGTILGNLSHLIGRIRALSPEAKLLVMNPIERTDFVYLFDPFNNAPGSYAPEHGQKLSDVAEAIYVTCARHKIPALDLHKLCGVTPENAVHFKRVRTPEGIRDLPWPEYVGLPFDPVSDPYPYPPEAHFLTYDGLHPTDNGNEILAALLSGAMRFELRR